MFADHLSEACLLFLMANGQTAVDYVTTEEQEDVAAWEQARSTFDKAQADCKRHRKNLKRAKVRRDKAKRALKEAEKNARATIKDMESRIFSTRDPYLVEVEFAHNLEQMVP